MKKNKILIVEDHEFLAKNIRRILEAKNYEIIKVLKKGEEVLKYLENFQPNIILLDIYLEGKLDGIQTAALIEKKWDLPIIFLTSSSEKEIINRAKKTGAFSYVTKDEHLKEQLPVIIEFAMFKHEAEHDKLKAYQKLSESESKFKSIASSAKDAIILINNDGTISFWNKSASKMFGYSSKDIKSLKFYDLITQEGVLELINKEIINPKGQIKHGVFQYTIDMSGLKIDSVSFPVELSLSNVKLNSQDCASAIIRDSTPKHEEQSELKNLQEENDKLSSFLENDIKSSLHHLIEYSDNLVKNHLNFNPEKTGEIAKSLDDSIRQMLKSIEELGTDSKKGD